MAIEGLKLSNSGRTRLRASLFPVRADVYVCDQCGTDVTKYLRHTRSHAWTPMGPERHRCECGREFLTGAVEWDHLADRQRQGRIRDSVGLPFFFSMILLVPSLVVYFLLHRSREALVAALVIIGFPLLLTIPFWLSVFASMRRTRKTLAPPRV